MSKHHDMSPSRWPGLIECNCYVSSPVESDAAKEGTRQHGQLEQLLSGETVADATDGVKWAFDEIIAIATAHTIHCEHRLPYLDGKDEAYYGRIDSWVFDGETLHVIDFKSGRETDMDYRAQLAGYALAVIQAELLLPKAIQIHILYGASQSHVTYTVSLAWCREVYEQVKSQYASTEKAQTPNTWCKYCANKDNCDAVRGYAVGIAKARAANISDSFWKQVSHPSTITDPDLMGKCLHVKSIVKEWCESVDYAAKQMVETGLVPTGYSASVKKGNREIVNIPDFMKALGITRGELPLKLTVSDAVEVVASKNAMDKKTADEYMMEKAGQYILRGEDSTVLRKKKG